MPPAYDAVVLAGGRARRMDGTDKVMQLVGGRPLLWRALEAVTDAVSIVIVGPVRPIPTTRVEWARERPAFGGPVAALAAGVERTSSTIVAVVAADTSVDGAVVAALVGALADRDELDAVLARCGGRLQPLVAAYRREALREALETIGNTADRPMHDLLAELRHGAIDASGIGDADTWQALKALRIGFLGGNVMIDEWTHDLAVALGLDAARDPVDVAALLDLARDAAHAVDRPAAPVTAFLVGYAAARNGGGPDAVAEATGIARELTASWRARGTDRA